MGDKQTNVGNGVLSFFFTEKKIKPVSLFPLPLTIYTHICMVRGVAWHLLNHKTK